MNPEKKGWLKDYLGHRKSLLKDYQTLKSKTAHPEQAIYRIIQPTGLMYGQSVTELEYSGSDKWSEKDKMKFLLAESLIGSSILFYEKPINSDADLNEIISRTVVSIGSFYTHVFPELGTSAKTWLGKKKEPIDLAEQILEKRVTKQVTSSGSFWVKFFNNSLLFLDVHIFGQWIHTKGDQIISEFFKYQREELRASVVKVITSAAHANQTLEFEERKLFDFFLQSSGLSIEKKQEAREIFQSGLEIEGIELSTNNSWILRKYFLEMAILTVWADKRIEETELYFLKRLTKHIGFSRDELDNSMLALQGFVLQHWSKFDLLHEKKAFADLSDEFIARLLAITESHKGRLIREAKENYRLMRLIKKANSDELSESEKGQIREHILTTLRTLPNFSSLSLPQGFLNYTNVIKVLPKNFFAEALA